MVTRIRCCVPHCARTTTPGVLGDGTEWICGAHWRAVSTARKADVREWLRLARKASARDPVRYSRIIERFCSTWEKARTEAIEAAVGIG